MADTLNCICEVQTEQGSAYWWPLICNVLLSHHFEFNAPDLHDEKSSYTYYRYLPPYKESTEEVKTIFGTFQELSDEVFAAMGSVVAVFLCQEDDGGSMEIDLHFALEKEKQRLSVGLIMPGGLIRETFLEKAQRRLKQFFLCSKDLYEICQPFSGEIYWENSAFLFAPWASISDICEALLFQRPTNPAIRCDNQQVIEYPLINGKKLFFFDPVPVLRKQNGEKYWDYFSLL